MSQQPIKVDPFSIKHLADTERTIIRQKLLVAFTARKKKESVSTFQKNMVCIAVPSTVSSGISKKMKKSKKCNTKTEREFKSLRSIVPSLCNKQNVDKLEVVLEAIEYIRQLEEQLCTIDPSLLKAAFVATACTLQH